MQLQIKLKKILILSEDQNIDPMEILNIIKDEIIKESTEKEDY